MSCQREYNPILLDESGVTRDPATEGDGDKIGKERDWQNMASSFFLLVFLMLIGLEKIRQLMFGCQLEMFDGLEGKLQESNSDREETERWVEEEESGDQNDNINRMLEVLGRQRRERLLSKTEGDPERNIGNGKFREVQIDQESVDFISAISQYIVLATISAKFLCSCPSRPLLKK